MTPRILIIGNPNPLLLRQLGGLPWECAGHEGMYDLSVNRAIAEALRDRQGATQLVVLDGAHIVLPADVPWEWMQTDCDLGWLGHVQDNGRPAHNEPEDFSGHAFTAKIGLLADMAPNWFAPVFDDHWTAQLACGCPLFRQRAIEHGATVTRLGTAGWMQGPMVLYPAENEQGWGMAFTDGDF